MKRQTFSMLLFSYIILWGIIICYLLWMLHCTIDMDYLKAYKIYQQLWYGALIFIISFLSICIIGSSTIEE